MKDTSALKENHFEEDYSLSLQVSELLFAVLPFAVVFLVGAFKQWSLESYLMAPEWAFASALLFGQTIVKIVSGATGHRDELIKERVILMVAILIVLCLVPSLVLLAIVLTASNPPLWMGHAQVVFTCIAAITFVVIGWVFHPKPRVST